MSRRNDQKEKEKPKKKQVKRRNDAKQSIAVIKQFLSLAEQYAEKSHFTSEECHSLLTMHENLCGPGKMDRHHFREFLTSTFDITDDIMLDLTFRCFDRNNDGIVDGSEFVTGLSTMLRGDLAELTEFCYYVYDMNGDRSLAREEFYHCLKGSIAPGFGIDDDEIDEAEKEIVEIVLRKLDQDRDSQVTYEDFQLSVKKDPLLIQFVGPCLPNSKAMATFLAMFAYDYRAFSGTSIGDTLSKTRSRLALVQPVTEKQVGQVGHRTRKH